eukprot:scaffold9697_cov114-Skeletonema_dohrnii-CCMP3373.AAC.5
METKITAKLVPVDSQRSAGKICDDLKPSYFLGLQLGSWKKPCLFPSVRRSQKKIKQGMNCHPPAPHPNYKCVCNLASGQLTSPRAVFVQPL